VPEYPDDIIRAVAERALEQWDLGATRLEFLSRSENVVFRVDNDCGETFVLRVHRPGYHTLAELNSEQAWNAALRSAGISVPHSRRTRAGEYYAIVDVPGTAESRHVSVVDWFEGVTMFDLIQAEADGGIQAAHFEQLGHLIARMHNVTEQWKPPAWFERHALDADGLMGPAPFWGPFWESSLFTPSQRRTVLEARTAFHAKLSALEKDSKHYGMIHADLVSANVLINGNELHAIDFDDAGFGWFIFDLVVALVDYADAPHHDAFRDALVAGYRSERNLEDEWVEILPMLYLVRALSVLGWAHERPEVDFVDDISMMAALVTRNVGKYL
jgi:Ser/Thr protein kinase RdoA (MazF antagonist)